MSLHNCTVTGFSVEFLTYFKLLININIDYDKI